MPHFDVRIMKRSSRQSAVASAADQSGERLFSEYDHKQKYESSLAPEEKPVAFCLDPETGFEWVDEYDITAEELLSGAGGNTAAKTEQAKKLMLDLLADGKELASGDIEKAAAETRISAHTVRAAKRNP